tara:strand:+ start:1763 stop:1951 length:189 start_codon:yes stop_codon:yes gene_type:complete
MRHRDVIDVYNNLIKQLRGKHGKSVHIKYPSSSGNIIVRDLNATEEMLNRLIDRRDYLLGRR